MDNINDFLEGYVSHLKVSIVRIVKSPLYISLFVLFLISIGSSAYVLFSSQSNLPSLPSTDSSQPSALVVANPSPTDTFLPIPTDTPIASATATPSPTPTDPTIGWDTYTNTTYGYSIKYPDGWIASDSGQLEPLIPSFIIFNPSALSASARTITISYTTRDSSQLGAIYGVSGQQMTVDNFSATQYNETDSDGNQTTSVILPVGINSLIFFSVEQYETTLMQMLGTFKLTS